MQCAYPINIPRPNGNGNQDRIIVPCGKCYVCKTRRRSDWTIRLTEEMKAHDSALFLTLTIADHNLHIDDIGAHLDKRDMQLFFKKLRKHTKKKIRYYCVGEYGTNTHRPHYHAIIFNLNIDDTESIEKAWSLGHVHIGDVNVKTIKYVTKYHVNKGDAPLDLSPEFTLMSTKPAIGAKYVDKMRDYHEGKIQTNFYQDFQYKLHLPRYYRDKLFTQEEREQIANKYQIQSYDQVEYERFKKKYPNQNYFKYLQDKQLNAERNFEHKKNINKKL